MEDNKTSTTTTTNNEKSTSLHELTLFESFTMGQKNFIELDNSSLSTSDPEFQKQAKQTIAHFITASMNANKQQIFSKNEELEDIRTDLLKYLLIPYYLSELYLKITGTDRLKFLKTSKQKIQTFLEDCERLKLIDKEDLEIINRDGKSDPANRRNELISRNKRSKEIKTKLEYCIKKRNQLLGSGDNNINSGGHEIEESDTGDEELDREFSILLIKEGIFKAVSLLETIDLEYNLLSQVEVLKEKNNGVVPPPSKPSSSGIGNFQMLPGGRKVQLDSQFKPTGQITYLDDRQNILNNVFKPSHILPTLTPEQAVEIEMKNGGMVKGKGGKESETPEKTDEQLDAEDDDDEQLKKKRNWDDWKDDNPKGAGNMKNRV